MHDLHVLTIDIQTDQFPKHINNPDQQSQSITQVSTSFAGFISWSSVLTSFLNQVFTNCKVQCIRKFQQHLAIHYFVYQNLYHRHDFTFETCPTSDFTQRMPGMSYPHKSTNDSPLHQYQTKSSLKQWDNWPILFWSYEYACAYVIICH